MGYFTLRDSDYEELVEGPEREIKNMLNYCGLEWESECLRFHKHKRSIKTASRLQVRRRMYKGSSRLWKNYEEYILPLIQGLDRNS